MTVDVVNAQNEKIGSVELRDELFGGRIKTDLRWRKKWVPLLDWT